MTRRPVVHFPIYHESCGFAGLASVELADGSWSPYLCSYCDREEITRLRGLAPTTTIAGQEAP